jgi:plastocyanin
MEPTTSATKAKSRRWLLPVALVLVLIAVGVAAWMIAKNSADQAAEETPTVSVAITDNGFSPATVKIKKGQDVTWTNQASKTAEIAGDADKPTGFKTSEALGKNDTYSFTFDDAGTFSYPDPNDLNRQGTIIVE